MNLRFKFPTQTNSFTITGVSLKDSLGAAVPVVNPSLSQGTLVSSTGVTFFPIVVTTDATGSFELAMDNQTAYVDIVYLGIRSLSPVLTYIVNGPQYMANRTISMYTDEGAGYAQLDQRENPVVYNSFDTALDTKSFYGFNLKSTTFADGQGITRYSFQDDDNIKWYNPAAYAATDVTDLPQTEWLLRPYYESDSVRTAQFKFKLLSNLANLYEQQAPVVLSIEVSPLNVTNSKVTVVLDKQAQCVIYVITLSNADVETSMAYFGRDALSNSVNHEYSIKKPTGKYRIVAIPSLGSTSRDFLAEAGITALNTYNYATAFTVESQYQEAYDVGYKTAHQQLYSLGTPYGWNFDFAANTNFGTSATQSAFVNTIADDQYIKAYKEVYDRGATFGFTYNGVSTSRSYYNGLRDAFIAQVGATASINTYKRLYDLGASYGFTYTGTSTDTVYYQNLENTFVTTIANKADAAGYKRAYAELFAAGVTYQQSTGIPEGFLGFVNDVATNVNFALKKDEFIRSMYNSGYLYASQRIFDLGIPNDYNFRTYLTGLGNSLNSTTLVTAYTNEGTNFMNTILASAQVDGYVDVYNYIGTVSGYTYNAQGAMTVLDYKNYLANQKVPAITFLSNKSKIEAYQDVFTNARDETGYVYTDSLNATDYSTKIIDMLGKVYRTGLIAGVQNVYDKATGYGVLTRTNYGTVRVSGTSLNTKFTSAGTTSLLNIAEPAYEVVFNDGIVSEAKRLYNYAVPYGFTYNTAMTDKQYYFDKESEYVASFASGAESVGIRKVFDKAATRYQYTYNNSNDSLVMSNQIDGMFTYVDNSVAASTYTNVYTQMQTAYGVTFVTSTDANVLAAQRNTLITAVFNKGEVVAYDYVMQQASTRSAYTYVTSTSSTTMKAKVIPMFKHVEDYRESDAYRRVHNYARNFLNIGYDFQDSPDPRVLENQVPNLFDFLSNLGGIQGYRYVLNMAKTRYPGFNYVDSNSVTELQAKIPVMFDYIDATTVDIISIVGPTFTYPDLTKLKVTLKRPMGIYCMVVNTATSELLAFYTSTASGTIHDVRLKLRPDQFGAHIKVIFVPSERVTAV